MNSQVAFCHCAYYSFKTAGQQFNKMI